MAAVHGAVAPFDPSIDEWSEYIERLQFYFTANGIKEDSKIRAVLLSCCGPSTFQLLRSLVLPTPLTNFSFSELVAKMTAHHEPRPSVIVQRYKFNTRQRLPSESVAEYLAALRKLAEFCSYGESLDEMLRDRLVCGIAHPAVQKRLLAESELNLTKAVSLAQSAELAEKGLQSLSDTEHKEVHKFSQSTSANRGSHTNKDKVAGGTCYRCGGKHNQLTCRFKSEVCHFCHKRGHIAKVCNSKRNQTPQKKTLDSSKPTHQVTQDPDTGFSEYTLFTMPDQHAKPLQVTICVEGHPLKMEVDTGAAVSIISNKTRNSIPNLQNLTLQPTEIKLRTYTGEIIQVMGELLVTVEYQDQNACVPLLVVQDEGPSLIGQNWLTQIRLDWKNIFLLAADNLWRTC